MNSCPLCLHSQNVLFDQDKARSFYQCSTCSLVFVPRDELVSPEEEKKRYDTHNNTDEDPRYEAYLQKIADAIFPHVDQTLVGLDFGCGETQLLQNLFQRNSISVDSYDIYFLPDETIWNKKYDFIILSEVIEHLRSPLETMSKLSGLLTPRGQLFIKTKFYSDPERFKNWYYKRDPTHIQFFNEKSFRTLSAKLHMGNAVQVGEDLYLFKK